MNQGVALATILAVIVSCGCSGGPSPGACVLNTVPACIDYVGSDEDARMECLSIVGEFDDNAVCPSEARLGGCRRPRGNVIETFWFYEGGMIDTETRIREFCDVDGSEFVPG